MIIFPLIFFNGIISVGNRDVPVVSRKKLSKSRKTNL